MSGAGATAAERVVDPEATGGNEGGEVAGRICDTAGTAGGSDAGGNRKLRSIVPLLLCRVSVPAIDFLGTTLSVFLCSSDSSSGVALKGFLTVAGDFQRWYVQQRASKLDLGLVRITVDRR
jgi:hypothetical protein